MTTKAKEGQQPTPRTDAAEISTDNFGYTYVSTAFARKLEREAAQSAQSLTELERRVGELTKALEDARCGLEVAKAALKTASHCMHSYEYHCDDGKFQNARDLVTTAFAGVDQTEIRLRSALQPSAPKGGE